jgi:hypothetical protein
MPVALPWAAAICILSLYRLLCSIRPAPDGYRDRQRALRSAATLLLHVQHRSQVYSLQPCCGPVTDVVAHWALTHPAVACMAVFIQYRAGVAGQVPEGALDNHDSMHPSHAGL